MRTAIDVEVGLADGVEVMTTVVARASVGLGVGAPIAGDATRREHLARVIQSILPQEEALPQLKHIHRFLANALELVPEIGAIAGEAGTLYTRISGGLAAWGRRLEFSPFRLRHVVGECRPKPSSETASHSDASAASRNVCEAR